MRYGLQFRDVFAAWESLLGGVYITLLLSAFAMLGGLTIGIICAAARVYGPRWLKGIAAGYVEIIRNTPLLVQLFLIFFGLPSFGIRLDGLTAAILALVINLGAYAAEIVRAGFEAVPKAQIEAGHSLGLSGLQFHAASIIQSRTFRDFEVYTVIGVLYLGLAFAFRGLFAGVYFWVFARR
ncbi:MAG: amino acid ABC transporter permease [Hyphomicrobiales bacterium]|nr:amino acid ABC transporter permease [Hyphomicrobiales bacterium]